MSTRRKYNLGVTTDTYPSHNSSENGTHLNGKQTVKKMASLTNEKDKALQEFKSKIQDIIKPDHDDYYLHKWLKARCYDVVKAEQMYRTSMTLREKMHIDTILEDFQPPEVLKKYLTGGFLGHARDGSQIRLELYGHLDIKGIMCSVRKSDLEKAKLKQCEMTVRDWKRQSEKTGHRVDGLTVIFDMEGVSTRMLWRPGMQMYLHLVKLLEDNYPEMMTRLLVINAPKIFPLLYKLARPLISEDMKNKIHITGSDYHRTLLKYIDEKEIPVCYGGQLTDENGDPKCSAWVCQGGDVPEKYYLQNTELLEHMKQVTIPKGDKLLLEYFVEKPGAVLRWEFKTDEYDIGFGVLYKDGGKNIPVVPITRVNSHVVTEDGTLLCEKTGTYFVCFDNTFSWTRGKKVLYMVETMYPDDDMIASEISQLIEDGDWQTLAEKFETTHL